MAQGYLNDFQYYTNSGVNPQDKNWGSYQYVSLKDIVNKFQLMYAGDDKLVNNMNRYNILFHAKRGIQEINYDALRSIKVLQLDVCDSLRFVLPPDYVNYVRISLYKNGVLFPMIENFQINYAKEYLQDNNCEVLFDINGNALEPQNSFIDMQRLNNERPRLYLNPGNPYDGKYGYCCDGEWYFRFPIEARFGMNTELANQNPTFRIDKKAGVINFDSGVAGDSVIVEYISDGMERGDDDEVEINKLAEDFLYSYIRFAILENKLNVPEYVVQRARKDKSAKLRNAKIRLSNLHPSRILMPLRGRAKWIK